MLFYFASAAKQSLIKILERKTTKAGELIKDFRTQKKKLESSVKTFTDSPALAAQFKISLKVAITSTVDSYSFLFINAVVFYTDLLIRNSAEVKKFDMVFDCLEHLSTTGKITFCQHYKSSLAKRLLSGCSVANEVLFLDRVSGDPRIFIPNEYIARFRSMIAEVQNKEKILTGSTWPVSMDQVQNLPDSHELKKLNVPKMKSDQSVYLWPEATKIKLKNGVILSLNQMDVLIKSSKNVELTGNYEKDTAKSLMKSSTPLLDKKNENSLCKKC